MARKTKIGRVAAMAALAAILGGCAVGDRLAHIGRAPELKPMPKTPAPPVERSISVPMPPPEKTHSMPASLWRTGARAFFRDQRASRVGDILTVEIDISDRAAIANKTTRSRDNSDKANLSSFLGYESQLKTFLPDAVQPDNLTSFGSTTSNTGEGKVDRTENIRLTIAAIVVAVLPNGNLVIEGRQEVRVNFEVRDLYIAGIVRPQDISANNTIKHTQIAEARISYGGRGQLTDVQQPRYGQQLYDIIFPF